MSSTRFWRWPSVSLLPGSPRGCGCNGDLERSTYHPILSDRPSRALQRPINQVGEDKEAKWQRTY